jgi:hypothetical protein
MPTFPVDGNQPRSFGGGGYIKGKGKKCDKIAEKKEKIEEIKGKERRSK